MLGINNAIVYQDMCSVARLHATRPVYLLTGWPNVMPLGKLVLKAERGAITEPQVRANVAIASTVDQSAVQVVLTQAERTEVADWARDTFYMDANDAAARDLEADMAVPGQVWLKMDLKQLTTLETAAASRAAGDKSGVRAIAAGLEASGGYEKLGAILAGDLYNGISDRFVWPGPGMNKPGGGTWRHLWNIGNVILSASPNAPLKPIGLDSFDPNNPYKDDQAVSVAAQEATSFTGEWPGRLLQPGRAADLATFVAGCVADIDEALGPRNRKLPFATTSRVPKNAATRVLAGVAQGANQIRSMLQNAPGPQSALTTDRRAILGW